MNNKSEIGTLGENIACDYLKKKGFTIIERNFRKPWGELDIIAKSKNNILVFVEVKTIRQYGNPAISPEENLTNSKLQKLKRIAYLYANENLKTFDEEKGWRIDLIAITLKDDKSIINYYENI